MPQIPPIRITVPTTIDVTVKQAQLVPYREFRPLRAEFKLDEQVNERYGNAGAKGDFRKLIEFESEFHAVKEMIFPFTDWRNNVFNDQSKIKHLQNPANQVALYFIGSKNFRQVADQPTKTEIFVVNDIFYRRMTWRSLGYKNNESGIQWKTKESITFFLYPCKNLNTRVYKEVFLDGIGIEVMKRDEPVQEEVEV